MDVTHYIATSAFEKIIKASEEKSFLSNKDKLHLIKYQIINSEKYIDKIAEPNLQYGLFEKIVKRTDYCDLVSFDSIWAEYLSGYSAMQKVSLEKPINFNYRTIEPPLSDEEFDKSIFIDHAVKDIEEYFHNTSLFAIAVLVADISAKKQCASLIRLKELNTKVLDFIEENIEQLAEKPFDAALSEIHAFSESLKEELEIPKKQYLNYQTKVTLEEYFLKRFLITADNLKSSYIIENNFTTNSIEYFLRYKPMQRIEAIRDKNLLKKFFSNYKKTKYNNDPRYWAAGLKRDIISDIFDFHGVDLLREENLNEMGIDSEWLSQKYQDAYYKKKGLFNCIDEMITSKNCNIRYLAATAMPYGDPRFKSLIQDRSKKVFLVALEKCSTEHLTFMLTSKKISGNSAKLIVQRRLNA
jgi:hypothetical protein